MLAIVSNVALSLFTLLVLVGEGLPPQARFIAFSFLLVIVPVLTAAALQKLSAASGLYTLHLCWMAGVCNLVLLAIGGWVVATQYPSHPAEPGLTPFAVLVLAAPVLSLVVLNRDRGRASARPGLNR